MKNKLINNALKMAQEMAASEAETAHSNLSDSDRWFVNNLKLMIDIQCVKVKTGKAETIDRKAISEWISKYS